MDKASIYLERASKAAADAAGEPDEAVRDTLLQIAETWLTLAEGSLLERRAFSGGEETTSEV